MRADLPTQVSCVCDDGDDPRLRHRDARRTVNGELPGPFPLFPQMNWWNTEISRAPVDAGSDDFIAFIGPSRRLHPDFGGEVAPGSDEIYGFPYIVVDGNQPKQPVQFQYSRESDGVDHATNQSYAFCPIPDEAITQAHWIESSTTCFSTAAHGMPARGHSSI